MMLLFLLRSFWIVMINNVIFLDIDGVLNCNRYFEEREYYKNNSEDVYTIDAFVKRQLYDIDMNKFYLLLNVIRETFSNVVITSSWRRLSIYPYIKKYLIFMGLPIIGETPSINGNRGEEIRWYLTNNRVDNFVILDDEIFKDFNELTYYLVKTNFYDDGLTIDHCNDIKNRLIKERRN